MLLDQRDLRAYDAVQLAGCLTLAETELPVFVCADQKLLQAAMMFGLDILDPLLG
jgi:hypothetical protein